MKCDSCENDAAFTWAWPWKHEVRHACCADCRRVVEVQASQLGRELAELGFAAVPRAERKTNPPPPASAELAEAQQQMEAQLEQLARLETHCKELLGELETERQLSRDLARQKTTLANQLLELQAKLGAARAPSSSSSTPSVVEGKPAR